MIMSEAFDIKEWGTFKDCLKAPVYGWFTYPAGFSYKAAEYSFKQENLKTGDTIYDPFMGSGTTNLAAKSVGLNSYGVEAHPFVYPITKCKMNWDIDCERVQNELNIIYEFVKKETAIKQEEKEKIISSAFPELVVKCFLPETLYELLLIRNQIRKLKNEDVKLFLNVGLICCLRDVSIAATGWPYIAPNKIKITSLSKNGLDTYRKRVIRMCEDVHSIKSQSFNSVTDHHIILGDSRNTVGVIPDNSIDHIFTSPPYLNNFDYADRTRLEMYFMGDADNWSDICTQVRTKLITSATTQISRNDARYNFLPEFIDECSNEYIFLKEATDKLSILRKTKGGKKSYDLLVIGYMNDLYLVLKDNYRVLKNNTTAKYILGDSAPYGVHIPTDELIGKIGVAIGFKEYRIDILRDRGGKWKNNPQRHNVELRETVVTLLK